MNLYGCSIGDNSKIGTFVEIQKNAVIGANVKISSHTFICEGVEIEDDVFVGHNVSFINDKYPRSTSGGGRLQTEADWEVIKTVVKTGRVDRHQLHDFMRHHDWRGSDRRRRQRRDSRCSAARNSRRESRPAAQNIGG